jgi:hypothetical protein
VRSESYYPLKFADRGLNRPISVPAERNDK